MLDHADSERHAAPTGLRASAATTPITVSPVSPAAEVLVGTTATSPTQLARKSSAGGQRHLFAGSFGGLLSSAALQPFDVVKTRLQQGRHGSLVVVFRDLVGTGSQRNVLRLWRGTLPSVFRSSVGSGLYFFTLNEMRQALSRAGEHGAGGSSSSSSNTSTSRLPTLSGQANLLTGAAARALVGFVMMPVTVVKVRYESSFYDYKSLISATRDIHATHGLRGFFKGAGATAMRDAPHAGLYVGAYEWCKQHLSKSLTADQLGPIPTATATAVNFVSGLTAGTIATLLTNPFDVLRTRLQLRPDLYRNFFHCALLVIRDQGPRALLDGVGIRVARKSVSSAFTWTLYEYLLSQVG
ncbi:hypothetical protein PYCC9005_004660 [Savitreella phatthalungensis]